MGNVHKSYVFRIIRDNVEAAPASFECVSTLLSSFQDLGQGLEETLLPLAWRIVNDSFRTDVCLLFPPFQIALACLHMASVILGRFYSRFYVLKRTVSGSRDTFVSTVRYVVVLGGGGILTPLSNGETPL